MRKATQADLDAVASHRDAELEAKRACRQLVAELGLDMKIVEARQAFEGGKLTITFYAEERVDFRELVGKLNERLKRRVELKQVSARDESRIVGGYGPCGRSLCCATFAGDQEPVSIRMAKDQNLPLNPTKISGCCGRLMCCLKYEHQVYVSFRKRAPKRGAIITTPGRGGQGRRASRARSTASRSITGRAARSPTSLPSSAARPRRRSDHGSDARRAQRTERLLQPLQDGDRRRRERPLAASTRWTSTCRPRASRVDFDAESVSLDAIEAAVREEGYEVAGHHVFGE